MSGFLLGDVPFDTVYLHGLVRAEDGKKMSKSSGNTMDPLEMADKYGADATRMSLIIGSAPGNDLKLSEDKVKGYKHFANKMWNATRFVLMNLQDFDSSQEIKFTDQDRKTIDEFNALKTEITGDIENYRFYLAGDKLYHYFWHTFADVIIEESKERISKGTEAEKLSAQKLLLEILSKSLKMLHPFMPFVTEELYEKLPLKDKAELLMIENWD